MRLGMFMNMLGIYMKSRREVTIIGPTIRAIRLVTVFSYLSLLEKGHMSKV